MNRSLSFQAACIRDVLPSARSEDISSGLSGAIRTIEWVDRNAEGIREFVRMMKECPIILEICKEFPGAIITDVRTIEKFRPTCPDDSGRLMEGADNGE